ncbi:DNA recombination protein RmuC [Algiphilus sp.]|uniref:DNA recombination protein RmuC n=1 Tax=Algiphilus sp. TaxID=1872431 RepID=UPI003B520FB6
MTHTELLSLLLPWLAGGLAALAVGLLLLALGRGRRIAGLVQDVQTLRSERVGYEAQAESMQQRLAEREQRIAELHQMQETLREQLQRERTAAAELRTRLEAEQKAAQEKQKLLESTREQLEERFKILSAEALEANKKSLLQLAEQRFQQQEQLARNDLDKRRQAVDELVKPLRESLAKLEGQNQKLEAARSEAYGALNQQMKALIDTHLPALKGETDRLVKALRQPHTRGRWGEVQLKRVAEMAGMTEHIDFSEQESVSTDQGGRLRPDMTVHLPGGRRIVVDSKAPVAAYLEAIEAPDEDSRNARLKQHAQQLRSHIQQLGGKQYFEQFDRTPEFVVLFVPGEVFFSEALKADPSLIEYGAERKVIVASPTSFIALLKAVSYGWRQEDLAENAEKVAKLGREIYDRIGTLAGHWQKVGKSLDNAVDAYNKAVGSLETRVLSSARKFRDLQVGGEALSEVEPIDHAARPLLAPEMQPLPTAEDRALPSSTGDASPTTDAADGADPEPGR